MTADLWDRYEALGEADCSSLTSTERAAFAICDLRQEVSSGGFDGYFRYWGANSAQVALGVLPEVLGQEWADLLAEGMRRFGAPFPADPDERAKILEEGGLDEVFDEMDRRFYALEEATDADARLTAFLNASD